MELLILRGVRAVFVVVSVFGVVGVLQLGIAYLSFVRAEQEGHQ